MCLKHPNPHFYDCSLDIRKLGVSNLIGMRGVVLTIFLQKHWTSLRHYRIMA